MARDKWISTLLGVLASAGVVLLSGPSGAHHSGNMFDREQTVELTGTVREFQWANPHIWIQVLVPDESGEVVQTFGPS